ncbi:hypothetical protein TNCT_240241 [Trichonephila clavata]|uniref:Uncharacterized protein n=1 Tax=Trichonephila clavata TaxID=2740835 RepID=A0A8X6LC68_TRICU|nr:hypothetical protein TNCT_240241 [Trichonephila clavata]
MMPFDQIWTIKSDRQNCITGDFKIDRDDSVWKRISGNVDKYVLYNHSNNPSQYTIGQTTIDWVYFQHMVWRNMGCLKVYLNSPTTTCSNALGKEEGLEHPIQEDDDPSL